MTDKEEKGLADADVKGGALVAKRRSSPEIGSTRRPIDLPTMAADLIYEGFEKILNSIFLRVEHGDLPALKLLVELAALENKGREVPAARYQSVAEVLWKSYQEVRVTQIRE